MSILQTQMVYQSNPAGIGEHPDLVQALESEVEKLASKKR